MHKESRERCHLSRLEWSNITPKNTEKLPAGTCSHSDQECQCQCARPAKDIIWIELHCDVAFVISHHVVRLHSVLVLSNKNSIPCVVVWKQQMSENLHWLRRHMKQAGNALQHPSYLATHGPAAFNLSVALTLSLPDVTYFHGPGVPDSPRPSICRRNTSQAWIQPLETSFPEGIRSNSRFGSNTNPC